MTGPTSRTVPLSTRATDILRALPRSFERRVFPVTPESVKKSFSRACERAGIENVVFHTLRHEATSRLAEKLPNVIELAAVTGHKDLRMLQRYYHPRVDDLIRKIG
ncbi:site-specific integrase [Noviherbaspirillum malthae]|uniref:site-specific integrase n=1 Tax=Noviherbaspirillum malthae TaxID=1260987 RepID=UPI001E49F962|nr:site-specific integrase [Noviherbaspirillum malthae]